MRATPRTAALCALALFLAACTAGRTPSPVVEPTAPAGSNDPKPTIEPTRPAFGSTPADDDMLVGEALVDTVEFIVLESFPLQVQALVRGSLPDGCTAIDEVTTTRAGKTFVVTMTTVRPAGLACTAVLAPFEQRVALDVVGLPAGKYTVTVNGVSSTFELPVDNVVGDSSAPVSSPDADAPGGTRRPTPPPAATAPTEGDVLIRDATVSDIDIVTLLTFPVRVHVIARGELADGCTQVHEVRTVRQGKTFTTTITTIRPADLMCIQVIVPFEEQFALDVAGLAAGRYEVIVNGVRGSFELN